MKHTKDQLNNAIINLLPHTKDDVAFPYPSLLKDIAEKNMIDVLPEYDGVQHDIQIVKDAMLDLHGIGYIKCAE